MQLISFRSDRQEFRVGMLMGDRVIDLAAAASHHGIDGNLARSMPALIRHASTASLYCSNWRPPRHRQRSMNFRR